MGLLEMLRVVVDETVGNRGAMRNCADELARRTQREETVARLCGRLPERSSDETRSTA